MIPVKAEVRAIGAYSSHADQRGIYNWLNKFKRPIKQIFVVHGEEEPALSLVQLIKDHLGFDALAPMMDEVVKL